MADKETGLNIPVSAVADKESAKEAVNELTKGILSSLKDGYIEIPAELKVPIKGASKDLEKAQKDVINQWEKTFKEGFSSSAKDLDNLTNAYQRFKKLAGQQHKANTKQSRGLSAIMGGPIQEYSLSKREEQTKRTELKRQIEKAQKQNAKKSTSKEDKLLAEEIANAIKQDNKRKGYNKLSRELAKGASRAKSSTPGAPTNLGIRSPSMSGPYMDERTLRMSEISPYRNMNEIRLAKEQQEIRKRERASLTSRGATTEDIADIDKKLKQRESSGRSQVGTEYDLIKKALLTEVAKIQGGLIKGKPDATSQKLIDQVLANLTYDEEQGVDPLKSVMGIHNMLQKRYDTKGKIGTTDGTIRGEGKNQEEANETLKEIYKILGQVIDARQAVVENVRSIRDTLSTDRASGRSSLYSQELNRITNSDQMQAMKEALRPLESGMTGINRSVKIGNTKEAVEFDQSEKIDKENKDINRDTARTVKKDAATGFNTDSKADTLIQLVSSILQVLQKGISINDKSKPSKEKELTKEQEETQDKTLNNKSQKIKDYSIEMEKAWKSLENSIDPMRAQMSLIPMSGTFKNYYEGTDIVKQQRKAREQEEKRRKQEEDERAKVQKSTIYASPLRQGIRAKLEGAFDDLIGTTKKYEKILKANADEQDAMAAERIRTYGLNNGRNPNDTGDIAGMRRILQLYRTNKESIEQNPELAQKIQLTPGRTVDTTELTRALNDALSGKNMRNAQMGGSIPRQILGGMTAFIGMPSLEKSRAQADGLNQILGNINNALQSVLINIQTKETELAGMEASGQAKFTKEGYLTSDSTSAAFKTLADLEEEKLVLDSIKADLLANDKIIDQTGGKFSKLVKNLSFTSPVLKENNGILRNINSGLDKNGKALKFQTRMAEILNYTFQLMSRSIGQMFKNWISMLNPLNVIKRIFEDYASYDPKWQRTMNVIKNNFREIILPFMEKIAQFLVNIIGFLDIISMKIQEAFGYTPISLFDQKNANDFKKTYEEISNITAGFDELHDIGSSGGENDPDNLLGEIYKPQLSQEWIDLANKIGDLFADVIKGDLGFGEAMLRILEILGETLAVIAKKLWDWFKTTDFGKWLIENWKTVLATILALFLGWKLLKIFGPTLLSTIGGAFKTLLAKVGGWITTLLGASGFGQGIMLAFQSLLAGGKYSLIGTLKEMFTNSAAITQAGSWGSMIGFALVKGLVGVLSIALGGKMVADAFDSAADKTSYNIGLEQAGGNEEDKKGIGGDVLKGAAGGAAIGFGVGQIIPVVGPLVGAAIGAVAGALTTSLAPAFEAVEVSAREANNEMQKIEHYEGLVQGYSTQVSELEELQQVLNDTLQKQTENIYAEGEQLGITKTRMDELVTSVQNGTFNTSMLSGAELGLKDSLIQLSEQQTKNQEATERLEAAKRKLQKAEIDLAIAEDVAAGNFEMAAARIDYAEAASLYTTEEATKKRIQLYKEAGEEEAAALLQDLTPQQRQKMADINEMTSEELASFVETWRKSSDEAKEAFLSGVDQDTQNQFESQMNEIDSIIEEHQGFWQGVGDTLKEIFTFGIADTWTYNGEKKATAEYKSRVVPSAAVGMNYVPNDGLVYLHQGEAVIPKKYNKPYEPTNNISQAYLDQMINTMKSLDNTIQQGIDVRGEFRQKGTDLVATVKKVENRNGNQPLNNPVFAR